MSVLVHGGDIYSASKTLGINSAEVIDFSANINPLGLPERVKQAIIDSLPMCSNYPDPLCRELVRTLAFHEQVPTDYILCGNGAADLIYRCVGAVCPKRALIVAPTFAEYELALHTVGCECIYYMLREDYDFHIQEDYLDYITEDIDMVILCNPNNPTGMVVENNLMKQIIKKCNRLQIFCMLDECFNDFLDNKADYTAVPSLPEHSTLIVLKAFTKIYAMAGIRLGYVLSANSLLLEKMKQQGQCWGVSVIAQQAGIAALGESDYLEETHKLISVERDYLKSQLIRLGMRVFDARANYIFFASPSPIQIEKALYEEGLLIRHCRNYKGLDETYYRIAVKTPCDNKKLITALERILRYGKTTYDSRNNI